MLKSLTPLFIITTLVFGIIPAQGEEPSSLFTNAICPITELPTFLGPEQEPSIAGTWTTRTPFPWTSGTYRSAGCTDGRYHYMVGGWAGVTGSPGTLNTLYRYDPILDVWTTLAPMPYAVNNHCAIYHPGRHRIYVVGGYTGTTPVNYNQEYDIATNTWELKAPYPLMRPGTAGAAIGDSIFVVAGETYGNGGEMYRYDIGTNTWESRPRIPPLVSHGQMVELGGKLYYAGGWSAQTTFYRYTPGLNVWEPLPSLPAGRHGLGLAVIAGKIYAYGGAQSWTPANWVNVYDPATNSWSWEDPMPYQLGASSMHSGLTAPGVAGRIYYTSGVNASPANVHLEGMFIFPDVGVTRIIEPTGIKELNTPVIPACSVYNYGNGTMDYTVRMKIGIHYDSTVSVSGHNPGEYLYITFPEWIAGPVGMRGVSCSTQIAGDIDPTNDKETGTVKVTSPPGPMKDVGVTKIVSPLPIVDSGTEVIPACSVYNFGTTTESYIVRMKIGNFYDSTVSISGHTQGEYRYITFPSWLAQEKGTHTVSCSTELTDDMYSGNDKLSRSVLVGVLDVGTTGIVAPVDVVDSGAVVKPKARIKNFGNCPVTFDATFYIEGPVKWSTTRTITNLAPDKETTITFPDNWTANELGRFATRCTTQLTGDRYTENDMKTDTFIVRSAPPPPPLSAWQKLTEAVPTAPDNKNVKSGGLIINGGDKIYIVKGNNTKSFYSYVPGTTPVYIDSVRITGKKGVKKGTGMVFDGTQYLYFVPGTNTNQFWRYDTINKVWDTLPSVLGKKALKGGTGIAYAGDKVYLLKGSKTDEFYQWSQDKGWESLPRPPENAGIGKGYGDGSCLIAHNETTLYALRGKYNEFYKYNISGKSWSTESIMPFVHPMVKKTKKVGEGAAMVLKDGKIYAFKGNNTKEFWMYDPGTGKWNALDTIPKGDEKKYVKGGGGLCVFQDTIYALKGNNKNVIYKYLGTPVPLVSLPNTKGISSVSDKKSISLLIKPNPTKGFTTVYYNLPKGEVATLKIYNILGEVIYSSRSDKGLFTIRRLPAGIYLLRFNAQGYKEDRKLVVLK